MLMAGGVSDLSPYFFVHPLHLAEKEKMRLIAYGRQQLDQLVEQHGESGVADMVCGMVAHGASLADVAKAEGMPYVVLWKWVNGDEGRLAAYRQALEARADYEANRALEIADSATPEEVNLAKLKIDTRKWAASKWGKSQYGENGGSGGGVGVINITISPIDSGVTIEGERVEDA